MPEFSILMSASGLYLHSDGTYGTTPPPDVPIVQSPGIVLPISAGQLQEIKATMTSVSEAMTNAADPKSPIGRFLMDMDVWNQDVMDVVKDLGELAASIAKVIPYVGAAIALAETFGLIGSKREDDPAVMRRLDQIDARIAAINRQWQLLDAKADANAVKTGLWSAIDLADRIRNNDSLPTASVDWQALDADFKARVADTQPLTGLMNYLRRELWVSTQQGLVAPEEPGGPTRGWNPLRPFRLFHAITDGEPLKEAAQEPVGSHEQFDHRVMVRAVPAVVNSYLLMLATLEPEHRTTGRWRSQILAVAGAVEDLLRVMRTESLARTHFTAADLPQLVWSKETVLGIPLPPGSPCYDVGGFDLAAGDSIKYAWPNPGPTGVWDNTATEVTIGAVTYNWPAPAKWEATGVSLPDYGYQWRLTNAQECVRALNDETARRYAQLLQASGYTQLVQTAGLLRHLAVAPRESETVAAGFHTRTERGPRTQVHVTGRRLPPFTQPTSAADRYPQEYTATARITTQSPLRSPAGVRYRLFLRTLAARRIDLRSEYASVYTTGQASNDRGEPYLECRFAGQILDEAQIPIGQEGESAARTPRGKIVIPERADGVTLRADTFDLWVPVPAGVAEGALGHASDLNADLTTDVLGRSWSSGPRGLRTTVDAARDRLLDGVETRDQAEGGVATVPPKQPSLGAPQIADPSGQRRDLQRNQLVTVWPSLSWDGSLLTVSIRARPQDRNFDLYLVVEEELPQRQWRHISYRIPITGQLTYVPQSFLDYEAALAQKADRFWRDVTDRYAISVNLDPRDAIVQTRMEGFRTEAAVAATDLAIRKAAPELLAERMRAYGIADHG